ncbi:phenylacetic acid degradation protein paaN [Rhodobium orientis]|uniref:Phenylacetic acid degradation protein PaaN n=1 Tax=Rhodobium orientis TaxID=34017 RepID=A0A327K184_9HYPH|nr:phenylacetic acid degradation protein PaaN [Rhodobium orientis]MBB4302595.1 phenylacetic acid degradation protein paaN [Rhodobium orientis]MBK5951535.1 phenylacetic acid degradation protein PaaN [Rhodobium orientis]RAI29128.1 phenylacetic acid degradation protein PaaN [Rhodobium orientis]
MPAFFDTHRETLEKAVEAAKTRGFWTPYPEVPSKSVYGETAKEDGEAAFQALLGKPFDLDQPNDAGLAGKEDSPFGLALGITYPAATPDTLIAAAKSAGKGWAAASVEDRVGVALEILSRINAQTFLMAHAVMHTSGQSFMMAFQAGGPHAQDRGLEAVAYAYHEMSLVPGAVRWEKPQGKHGPLVMDKTFKVIPRGIALVIGCSTFPTWNTYPGLFASLVTGNPVIVKPHPKAILPLALTVRIGREVLAEAGFDPNVLLLAVDEADAPITQELVTHPDIAIVDFTGSPAFGSWVRAHGAGKQVFTEEAGVNSIVVDSTDNFRGMCANIAFSLSLYSGQMCTAPQNIYVTRDGIETDEGRKTFDEVADGIAAAVDKLLGEPNRALGILGAIQNPATAERVADSRGLGRIVRDSGPVDAEVAGGARTATPLILALNAQDEDVYLAERFGPISFVIATAKTAAAIARAAGSAKSRGAITAAIYSTDEAVIDAASEAFADAGVPLSVNLTGGIYVNQSAAFSDYHVTGANPAGNACLTDAAFVANRFRVATVRRQA